jgi:hypothetical protein
MPEIELLSDTTASGIRSSRLNQSVGPPSASDKQFMELAVNMPAQPAANARIAAKTTMLFLFIEHPPFAMHPASAFYR